MLRLVFANWLHLHIKKLKMKSIRFTKGLLPLMLLAVLFMLACRKKTIDKDTQAAEDNSESEMVCNDASNMSDAAALGVDHFRVANVDALLSACATVTRDTVSVPHVITIDFGTSNCTCQDGRTRRGSIHIAYTGGYFQTGTTRTITFTDYYVNDKHVEGTHTVTNNGLNSAGNYTWTVQAADMRITRPTGEYHTWNSTRTREMIAGASTPILRNDDIYLITGTASGVNINGVSYTANIVQPLRRAVSCQWIESGTIEITPANLATRTLDFGNTGCDNQATVTVNSNTYSITLH